MLHRLSVCARGSQAAQLADRADILIDRNRPDIQTRLGTEVLVYQSLAVRGE